MTKKDLEDVEVILKILEYLKIQSTIGVAPYFDGANLDMNGIFYDQNDKERWMKGLAYTCPIVTAVVDENLIYMGGPNKVKSNWRWIAEVMVSEIEELNHVVVLTIKHMKEDFLLEAFIKDGAIRFS